MSDIEQIWDPLSNISIQYLTVNEILKLCKTNKYFRLICQDQGTWRYLLERDFGIRDSTDPKAEYQIIYEINQWRIDEEAYIERPNYLWMFDIAGWNLFANGFPDLNVNMLIQDPNSEAYIFLRRLLFLHASRNRIHKSVYMHFHIFYPTIKTNIEAYIDLLLVRGSQFVKNALENRKIGYPVIKSTRGKEIPFYLKYMPRNFAIQEGYNNLPSDFRDMFLNFEKNPIDDPILNYLEPIVNYDSRYRERYIQ